MAITKLTTSGVNNIVKYDSFLAGNPPADFGGYWPIASATGTGSSGTITFSSIPSTYKHLQIRGVYYDGGYNLNLQMNGDTGSNYSRHILNGNGTSVSSSGAASQTSIDLGSYGADVTNNMSICVIDILDYSSTTKNKTVRALSGFNGSSNQVWVASGLWMSTSAITSISILDIYGSYNTNTQFALYGIKEA